MSYLKEADPISQTADIFINVVSILLAALLADWLSKNEAPPERLILDRLTFTNSRLILRESFRPVTEVGSSSTLPSAPDPGVRPVTVDFCFPAPYG